jgi:hypothetical protein
MAGHRCKVLEIQRLGGIALGYDLPFRRCGYQYLLWPTGGLFPAIGHNLMRGGQGDPSGAFSRVVSPMFSRPVSTWSIYHCPQAKNGCEAS